jgi:hypothetical protein
MFLTQELAASKVGIVVALFLKRSARSAICSVTLRNWTHIKQIDRRLGGYEYRRPLHKDNHQMSTLFLLDVLFLLIAAVTAVFAFGNAEPPVHSPAES